MIGNPVSMPRVVHLVEQYRELAGADAVQVVEVSEQEIMDAMLTANRNGHVACTQGGESLAGIRRAVREKRVPDNRVAVLDATAHALKFATFQEKYFADSFDPEFEIIPKAELQNAPFLIAPPADVPRPAPGSPLEADAFKEFVEYTAGAIAEMLELKRR